MLTNFEKEMVKIYNETTKNKTVLKQFLNSYLPGKQARYISYTVKLVYNHHPCDPQKVTFVQR